MPRTAVLHVTSLFGGGVDRHVRDLMRALDRPQFAWHVGDRAEVLEAGGRYRALDPVRVDAHPGALADWLRARRVGLAHVHSLQPRIRGRARQVKALGLGLVATLHDVLFLRPDAFERGMDLEPDREWLAESARFLREADAVLAPSEFIADLARRHMPGIAVDVVPNGSAPQGPAKAARRREFAQHSPRHVVAVLGAVGPHKGSDLLEALARELEGSGIAIVVVGYLDRQVIPGWRVPGTYFIHGPWQDAEVPSLLEAYGALLVLFPNAVPESFSYTLSDAWACGLPVLAAPHGALGERIARHGGGWLLPARFDAVDVARRLRELLSPDGADEVARVKSRLSTRDPARIPSLDAMARSLDALYERFGVDAASPAAGDPEALEGLLAANLDGSVFRAELARLADELAQAHASQAELDRAIAEARRFEADSRAWIAKLEGDVAGVRGDAARAAERAAALEAQVAHLEAALARLPRFLRYYLLKAARDARS